MTILKNNKIILVLILLCILYFLLIVKQYPLYSRNIDNTYHLDILTEFKRHDKSEIKIDCKLNINLSDSYINAILTYTNNSNFTIPIILKDFLLTDYIELYAPLFQIYSVTEDTRITYTGCYEIIIPVSYTKKDFFLFKPNEVLKTSSINLLDSYNLKNVGTYKIFFRTRSYFPSSKDDLNFFYVQSDTIIFEIKENIKYNSKNNTDSSDDIDSNVDYFNFIDDGYETRIENVTVYFDSKTANITLVNGKLSGKCEFFYHNGNLEYIAYYNNEILHGKYESWYENKNKKSIGFYQYGKKHGHFIEWDENGNVISDNTYLEDKIVFDKKKSK